jgi:hypothetical protein
MKPFFYIERRGNPCAARVFSTGRFVPTISTTFSKEGSTMNMVRNLAVAAALLFLVPFAGFAQQHITSVTAGRASEGKPVSIAVELTQNTDIQRLLIHYRGFGVTEFKEQELLISGRSATVTLPGESILPPTVEYYIEAFLTNGKSETYPVGAPGATPLRIEVTPTDPKDKEVRVMSPEPGEAVPVEDLVVAISLYYASPAVDVKATRIALDGVDVSAHAVFSDDVILYSPKNFGAPLKLGSHSLKVELRDTTGKPYHTIESTFAVSTAAAIAAEKARLQANGNAQLEVRDEALGSGSTTYVRGDTRVDATYGPTTFGGSIHLDNQNTADRQPQNRFLLYGGTDWLRIQVGDAYPKFPSDIMSGKRVRGITGNLALGAFNLDVTYGQTDRFVEGIRAAKDSIVSDTSARSALSSNKKQINDSTFRFFAPGVFTRTVFAIRPSFGSGENFQLGFTYAHAKDDSGSITYGVRPRENLVAGSDVTIAFDDQRFKLEAQAAVGMSNEDITGGSFTQAQYDSMKAASGNDLSALGKILEKFITVNQNLFPTNPVAKGLPGIAAQAVLSLNYFNNFIRGTVFHRGAGYQSFENEYLQTDLDGFQVSDNIRMFSNRAYLSLSYEHKADNTASTKEVTTAYNNLSTSLNINPGPQLPTFQLGFGHYSRLAPIDYTTKSAMSNRPDSASATNSADDGTNRIFGGVMYDFTAGVQHTASFNISVSNKTDNTFHKLNQSNLYLQASVLSQVMAGWQTNVGIVYSHNTSDQELFYGTGLQVNQDSLLLTTKFNYAALTFGFQARMLENTLRLIASFNPTLGAISRQEYIVGADYTVARQHVFALQANYLQNSGAKDDAILSFIYRLNF